MTPSPAATSALGAAALSSTEKTVPRQRLRIGTFPLPPAMDYCLECCYVESTTCHARRVLSPQNFARGARSVARRANGADMCGGYHSVGKRLIGGHIMAGDRNFSKY
jgi:hypothetical protein